MVSSVVPGATTGAGALGVDARLTRSSSQGGAIREETNFAQDRVEISGPAAMAAARESVSIGLAQVQQALSVARDAQTMLLRVQGLAADPNASQSDLSSAVQDYAASFGAAAKTNALVKGQPLSVTAEPGSPPLMIAGADLTPGGDVIAVPSNASVGDSALPNLVQGSLDRLQTVMENLGDAGKALQAHQTFLSAAQNGVTGVTDLNADSARLMALQVRQGLETAGGRAIANVEPQAVLALFRA
ncbi:MAG: hypothetical protein JSS00_01970 [Proteobacteria bacterium]|nr:hypothetical protein [Pseudomonadota bacterium]